MRPWAGRLIRTALFMLSIAVGVGIILKTFNENISFFYTPTDFVERPTALDGKLIRVGGMVKEGSIRRDGDGVVVFTLTDYQSELRVRYNGILPNLFKEKQGTVALGKLDMDGTFYANEVLAKHDENYMPKELRRKLNVVAK